jgi:hypothetical protein
VSETRTQGFKSILLGYINEQSFKADFWVSRFCHNLRRTARPAPIQALFDGIAQRNKTAMLEVLLPDGGATIVRNGQILQFNLRALVERLAAHTERSEERIYDSLIRTDDEIATVWDPLIRMDEDIAMVWARYEFLIHGGIHHYGTNVFNLVRRDERWLIAGVANNSRQVRKESVDA